MGQLRVRPWLLRHRLVLSAIAFWLLCHGADIASSVRETPDWVEANAFTRHPDGRFWLAHAIVVKSAILAALLLFSWTLWYGLRQISEDVATVAAALPFWYYGFYVLINAVLPNLFVMLGYHVDLVAP